MQTRNRRFLIFQLAFGFAAILHSLAAPAQEGNPFDLSPRLETTEIPADSSTTAETGNPFDLVAPTTTTARPAARPPAPPRRQIRLDKPERTLLITIILNLLALTILITLFRAQLQRAYRAFLNDNMLSQLQREREGGGGLPYYILYGWFFVNAGLFLYLLCGHYGISIAAESWRSLLYAIGGVSLLFLGKHLLLSLIGYIFPVKKEVQLYSFTIIVFSIILSLCLVLANMLIAYSPEEWTQYLIWTSLGVIGGIYVFRSLRALFIGNRFLALHFFHFLLYICTVEIAPVLVLAKLITG